MHKYYTVFYILLFLTNTVFAQETPDENKYTLGLNVINKGSHVNRDIYIPEVSKLFNLHGHSSHRLDVKYEEISQKVIEGMETFFYVDYSFVTNFYSNYGDEKFSSNRIIKGRGSSHLEAMQHAFKKFATTDKNFRGQLDTILTILNTKYADNCEDVLRLTFPDDRLFAQIAVLKYIPKRSPCYEKANKLIGELTLKQETLACKETIRKMNIRIESKTFDANMLVRQLVNIPATSPCAKDALTLAKKIGKEQKDKLNSGNIEKLNIYINNFSK